MDQQKHWGLALVAMFSLVLVSCSLGPAPSPQLEQPPSDEFVFGVILVGAKDDHGWSEAHYVGGQYVQEKLPDTRMILVDNLNPEALPEMTIQDVVDDMVSQGAKVIMITSDDFSVDTYPVAAKYPDIAFIHISGDHALKADAPSNVGNYMARMVYGKMIAGCAAALTTQTGSIGYVGPLINHETRRLANASYLGARHCYETYRDLDATDLEFRVEWIGYWFHIPGVTLDPNQVASEMIAKGVDVLLSGIDTTEALEAAAAHNTTNRPVWAIAYDYEGACGVEPEICLGVPYFNWGPGYLDIVQRVRNSKWTAGFEWVGPNWDNINDRDTSALGYIKGPALSSTAGDDLDEFVASMARGDVVLFQGPLYFQNDSTFLEDGEKATDEQIWYMPQLLTGMDGLSE